MARNRLSHDELDLKCSDFERQIQLDTKTDLNLQCMELNLCVYITNSSLRSNLLGDKCYVYSNTTLCSTLLVCDVTTFCCFRFHYSVRALKDGEKKEGKF
jgi:hypothetical protein